MENLNKFERIAIYNKDSVTAGFIQATIYKVGNIKTISGGILSNGSGYRSPVIIPPEYRPIHRTPMLCWETNRVDTASSTTLYLELDGSITFPSNPGPPRLFCMIEETQYI